MEYLNKYNSEVFSFFLDPHVFWAKIEKQTPWAGDLLRIPDQSRLHTYYAAHRTLIVNPEIWQPASESKF